MPNHPRLLRRGASFYHRAAVPADIKATYPKTEETFSLRTKDFREAVRRARVEAARVFQPRMSLVDEKHVSDLRASLETVGELTPVIVIALGKHPVIVDGHHRSSWPRCLKIREEGVYKSRGYSGGAIRIVELIADEVN